MTHAEVDVDCIIFTLRVTNQDQLIVMLLNQYYQEHDFLIIHNKKKFNPVIWYRFHKGQHQMRVSCDDIEAIQLAIQ